MEFGGGAHSLRHPIGSAPDIITIFLSISLKIENIPDLPGWNVASVIVCVNLFIEHVEKVWKFK